MPTIKQLPAAISVAATDLLPLSQGGTTKALAVGSLLSSVQPAISVAPAKLLGRISTTAGGPEVVAIGAGLQIAAGSVSATGADHTQLPISTGLLSGDEVVVNTQGQAKRLQASLLRGLFAAGSGVTIDGTGVISATGGAGGVAGVSTFNTRAGPITLTATDLATAGGALASSLPPAATVAALPNGMATAGSSTAYARQDHVHPTDTTRLGASNNLADVGSVVAARGSLGLGGAAVLNVGAVAGSVAAGDDARITGALQAGALGGAGLVATGTTAARALADRASDAPWLHDFTNADGSAVDRTGTKDCAAALSQALANGNVRVAPGTYLIASAVRVPARGVGIYGSGWDEAPGIGTWFKISGSGFLPFNADSSFHFVMRDVAFMQAQPVPTSSFTPTAYPFILTSSGGCLDAENLLFWGCTNGINLTQNGGGAGSVRHSIRKIHGQTFGPMIQADVVVDTMVVDDIHHWPHWSFSPSNGFSLAQQQAIYNYQTANTDVVLSKRNDDPFIRNVFGYGVRSTIHFSSNTTAAPVNQGATSLAYVDNIGADASRYLFLVTAANTTLTANRVQIQAYDPGSSTLAVLANSAAIMIDSPALDGSGAGVTGCIITAQGLENSETDYGALQNFGSYNIVRLTDPKIRAWDAFGKGHYAMSGGNSTNTLMVSNPLYLLAPSTNLRTDGGALHSIGGSASSPGLQVGDGVGTGLWADGGELGVLVAGNQSLRLSGFDPAAHIAIGGTSTNLYLSAEGSGQNVGFVITPSGTGIVDLNGAASVNGSLSATTLFEGGLALGAKYAATASPAFTGAPTAPTASNGTNSGQVATTAFVQAAIGSSGKIVTSGSSYAMQNSDRVVIVRKSAGSATGIGLPSTPPAWVPFVVKDGKGDAASNAITVTAGAPIDGAASFVLNQGWESVTLVFNGIDWSVI